MKTNFKDLPATLQLILYLRTSRDLEPNGLFCTSDPKYLTAAEQLIAEGKIIEIDGPGGPDRAFKLIE